MKTMRIYAMFALLLMAGEVTMQAQEYNSNKTITPSLTQYDYKTKPHEKNIYQS